MGSAPVYTCRCPMPPHFLTCEFLGYWAGSGILGFHPCWCPSAFPSPSISRCFSIHSFSPVIEFHSCFLFTTNVSAPINRPFTYSLSLVRFQVWGWLWYPMVPRRNRGAYGAEI